MKIIRQAETPDGKPYTYFVGLRCDICGVEARHQLDLEHYDSKEAIAASMAIGYFARVDLDTRARLSRLDICGGCSHKVLRDLRDYLNHFRTVAEADPASNYHRRYRYTMLEDGQPMTPFKVESIMDEDLHITLF